jgi:acyl carrier protein
LAKSIAMEYPELRCSQLDIDTKAGSEASIQLVEEILSDGKEDQVSWRGQQRHVARLERSGVCGTSGETSIALRADASYLITGGLGGLGLLVARWMIARGARRIILVGRSSASESAEEDLDALRAMGADILVASADVSDESQLGRVISETADDRYPLRGVVHAAGTLDNGLLSQQNSERFIRVMAAKVAGAWNLHQLTADCDLDLFVLFSSVASVLGSPGQANHSAANAFMDSLAHYRCYQGLPGLSINWGAWARVGSAVQYIEDNPLLQGAGAMEPEQGLWILEQLIASDGRQAGVIPIDWSQVAGHSATSPYLAALTKPQGQSQTLEGDFLQQLSAAPVETRSRLLGAYIHTQLANVLGLDPTAPIDTQQGLFDLGMDSLTAVEFRNRVQSGLGCTLSSTLAFNYPSIEAVANYLQQEVLDIEFPAEAGVAASEEDLPAEAEMEALDELSESELAHLLEDELKQIGQDS